MKQAKKVMDRRTLRFGRIEELVADVEQFDGAVRATGNWTPAQIVQHVSRTIDASVDGFQDARLPFPMRVFGRLLRNSTLNKPMSAGFKLPSKVSFLAPDPEVEWDGAVDGLRRAVERARSEGMRHASPFLGPLNEQEWQQLHCRHAELHFSFLHPAETG